MLPVKLTDTALPIASAEHGQCRGQGTAVHGQFRAHYLPSLRLLGEHFSVVKGYDATTKQIGMSGIVDCFPQAAGAEEEPGAGRYRG
jgi:hypothetical protein